MIKHESIDAYIAEFPPEIRTLLDQVRAVIQNEAPDATEAISYGIPTFKYNGKNLVHFAAFQNHIGFYPTPVAGEAFKKELAAFKTGKGSVQFPYTQPLPIDLISRIVKYRLGQT